MNTDNITNNSKAMPFAEDDSYVEHIIAEATEKAIHAPHKVRWNTPLVRIAASVVLIAALGYTSWSYHSYCEEQAAPLDTFLSSISDDEASLLVYYDNDNTYLEEY